MFNSGHLQVSFNLIGTMHLIFTKSFFKNKEYVHCADFVGGAFSSSNPKSNPYMPGKSVLETINGCGSGCSGGGVVKAEVAWKKLSTGSCLTSVLKLWSCEKG